MLRAKRNKIVFKMNSSIIKWIKVIPTTNTPLYMYCSIVMKCDQNTKCDVIYSIQHLLVVWRNRFSIWESRTLISVVVWLLQRKILIVSQYFNCDPWLKMISRRRIITQSLQKIDYQNHRDVYEEDIWFNKEKLYKVSKVGNNCVNFFI